MESGKTSPEKKKVSWSPNPLIYWKDGEENKQDLHWRGPVDGGDGAWVGNFDVALEGAKKRWVGKDECGHCGGLPCPWDSLHGEAERKQRVKDLQFVQKTIEEMKELEAKYKKVCDKNDEMADTIRYMKESENDWKIAKLLMARQIQEKDALINQHIEEKHKLMVEVSKLKQNMHMLREENSKNKKKSEYKEARAQRLSLDLAAAVEECDEAKVEIERTARKYRNIIQENLIEIEKLKKEVETINEQLVNVTKLMETQKHELNKMTGMYWELKHDNTKDEIIDDLKKKLSKSEEIKDIWISHSQKLTDNISELEVEITDLKSNLKASQQQCQKKEENIRVLQMRRENDAVEITRLQKRLQANNKFNQFMDIKKEMTVVKQENNVLRNKINSFTPVPVLQRDGSVREMVLDSAKLGILVEEEVQSKSQTQSMPNQKFDFFKGHSRRAKSAKLLRLRDSMGSGIDQSEPEVEDYQFRPKSNLS
ncbi:unnamed protein product [Owenia fusiformis]|uniref:Uncharacterized protein n=1 Tax=Owenia fusiformis TaxID=6347 RepID=A0A8S4Q5Z2_OWEFU|nr:unnamed protein product [Owenia fusiformis]